MKKIDKIKTSSSAIKPKNKSQPEKAELLYYGKHICQTLFQGRKEAIIRVYCTLQTLPELSVLLKWCALHKKAYHVVTKDELARITQSVHHEDVAILAHLPEDWKEESLWRDLDQHPSPLLYVDGVQNPHNLGAIMRSMAHFGFRFLIGSEEMPKLSSSAARMSEGGSEWVHVCRVSSPLQFLSQLKSQGYLLCGSSSHVSQSLYETSLPQKVCFILGHESYGISEDMQGVVDCNLVIPGQGKVESLNVSVASALLMGEYWRQNQGKIL